MIGKECIRPLWVKHLDWCGLAGIVQAIVKTFPKNCALMFPPPAPLAAAVPTFSSSFKPASSDEEDDNDHSYDASSNFRQFETSSPALSSGMRGGLSEKRCSFTHSSTPLPHGGAFTLATDSKEAPSSSLGAAPAEDEEPGLHPGDDEFDVADDADNEGEGEKDPTGDEPSLNPAELEILQGIINPVAGDRPSLVPKSGDKQGSTHLGGDGGLSDSSGEDLDAKNIHPKKKGSTPTKAPATHPKWVEEDVDMVCQIRYKTDFARFQNYRQNKINPSNLSTINTKDHNAYIDVVWVDPSSVIAKSMLSVAAYRAVLKQKGGDIAKFDKEVGTKFKKGPKGSWAPDNEKVAIDWVMLVCQRENGVNMAYSDSNGFGCPGTMGLWDLHSSDALSRAKMQLSSGLVDANFCPLCFFFSTNNETLNNHIRKHYKMGLICPADGFTTASVGAMKTHMETKHRYEGKCVVKKSKGKG